MDKTPPPPRQIHSSDKILLLNDEILVLPHDIEGEDSGDIENVFYTKADSRRLEKFLLEEAAGAWKKPEKKCHRCDIRCEVCDLMNRDCTRKECDIINRTWHTVTAKEVYPGAGKFTIQHEFQYRNDPGVTYHPARSNIRHAEGHARKVIKRAAAQGSLALLDEQVMKMIEKRCFVELNAEEIKALGKIPHFCVFYNWVHNSNSSSTPFRMVSNTSAISNQTTLSTEQMAPANVLNPQENVIVRFQLFPVPLCGDIAGAHHTIEVDEASSFLRLFFYFWDIPECTQPRIFRKVSQDFGDLPAASGLETGILKFVLPAAVHPVRAILR